MNKVIHGTGFNKVADWHPNVPCLVAPKIFKRTVTIDGIVYYRGEKGRMFIKELFDKMFKRIEQTKSSLIEQKLRRSVHHL